MNTKSPSILIVDDEEVLRSVCRRVLAPMGYQIDTAANADEAIHKLNAGSFDLVLTDLAMPGSMNGAGLLNHIHAHWPSIKVLMMTAFPDLESAIGTMKGGALDYLVKPFTHDQLKTTIARALQPESKG